MFRLLASALRDDPQPTPTATTDRPPSPTTPPSSPPLSPRLQIAHAQHLSEALAIARADLAAAHTAHTAALAHAHTTHSDALATLRTTLTSRATRAEARASWLEDTVRQLSAEKAWLAKRNEALEEGERAWGERVRGLEEEVWGLREENGGLRREGEERGRELEWVVGEVGGLRRAAEEVARRAVGVLGGRKKGEGAVVAREKEGGAKEKEGRAKEGAVVQREGDGEEEEGGDEDATTTTPRAQRIEAPEDPLSGETLRTAPRSGYGHGEGRGRASMNSQVGGVDPRSLEALRTLGSPTPERGGQRRLGGSGTVGAVTASAGTGGRASDHVTMRSSRKRQRTASDEDADLTA